ncbi:MAG: HAMP domain-containing sensor histidine kinase [Lachnospiraceae bacterium]|nr:HAMP domain-containing sensor histidine kinase [Lachnospiraceae bacterium]
MSRGRTDKQKKVHRLRNRIILITVILLLFFFGIFTAITVWTTQKDSIAVVEKAQSAMLMEDVKSLEYDLRTTIEAVKEGDMVLQNAVFRYYAVNNVESRMAVYQGGQELYNNTSYEIVSAKDVNSKLGLIRSSIDRNAKLLILYTSVKTWGRTFVIYKFIDISAIYAQISRQIMQEILLSVLLCLLLGIVLQIVMRKMFRPLEELRTASGNIAAGEYGSRVQIHEMDEIGQVSNSFNIIAERVEGKISELTRMNEQQNQMLGSLAHELKTPMTALIGYADTLQKLKLPPEKEQKALGYISTESRRLSALSEKMLELTGIQKTGSINCTKDVPMEKLLCHAMETVSRKAQEKGVKLCFQKDAPGDVTVVADWDLMVSLAVNLLDNAIKVSPEGGQVRLVLEAGCFWVEDEGYGIAQEEMEHIKEAFYMVDKSRSRRQGGAGLGLTLCEQIVRLYGMDWTMASAPGEGTRVTVTFQLQLGEDLAKDSVVG